MPVAAAGWLLVAVVALAPQQPEPMTAASAGQLEGRPPAAQQSPLQARIDAAAPGATIEVAAGTYEGDLYVDRTLRLIGTGRPRLLGSGQGSVIRVRADDVTIEGFDIDGRGGGDLARDSSGVHVAARRAVVRDCRIERAIFGIYLREADGAAIERVTIAGVRGREPGEQGSGIHVWNTTGFRLVGNRVRDSRDGFYLQSSTHGFVAHNVVTDVRYGLHYMFSDDNVFEDNRFERSAAGAALMYSKRLAFRRNQFLRNRGFNSVGLLLKTCDQVVAEANLIAGNGRGVFLEGSTGNVFRGNVLAKSDVAIVLYDSSHDNRFAGNAFVDNSSPLQLVGRRTDTVFDGNYFSDGDRVDLDGDGVSDRPYRLSNVFDHLRGNLLAADLFVQSAAAAALASAERAFPVLDPVPVVDAHPLVRPLSLPDVPAPEMQIAGGTTVGLLISGAILALGVAGLRPRRR